MQIAIVGLAGSGKTTVFNTLTRGDAQTGGFGGMELHVGVVKVPDERLDRLAAIFHPKKIVHADVTYVDLPAPPASSEGRVGHRGAAGRAPRPGSATPTRCSTSCGPGTTRTTRTRPARSTRGATSSSSTSSSSSPTSRWSTGGWSGCAATGRHGTPAEREANEREAAILDRLRVGARRRPPDPRRRPRRRRGEGDPRLPLPDPEAGPRPAQRRRGATCRGQPSWSPRSPAATTTGTRSSTRCRRGSRWSSASSSPTRRRSSPRSSGSPRAASTA